MRGRRRSLGVALGLALAGATGLSATAGPALVGAAQVDETAPLAALHTGDCRRPNAEAEFPLAVLEAEPEAEVVGRLTTPPLLNGSGSVEASLADLLDEANPYVLLVHASTEEFGTILACGEVAGVVVDDQVTFALRPVGGSTYAGLGALAADEAGGTAGSVVLFAEVDAFADRARDRQRAGDGGGQEARQDRRAGSDTPAIAAGGDAAAPTAAAGGTEGAPAPVDARPRRTPRADRTPGADQTPAAEESPTPGAVETPTPGAETPTPGVETPPAETPPAETPPVETPPVETPPVETPAETPPVETPAAETPPAETPTVEPPVETPTVEPPPVDDGDDTDDSGTDDSGTDDSGGDTSPEETPEGDA